MKRSMSATRATRASVVQDLEVKQQRALKEQIVVVADHEEAVALVAREAFEVVDVEAFGGVQRDERFHRDGFGGGGFGRELRLLERDDRASGEPADIAAG